MNKLKKGNLVSEITDKIKKAKGILFIDFKGLKVKELDEIRNNFKNATAEIKVLKNTLAQLSFKKSGYEEIPKVFIGSTAVVFENEDLFSSIKITKEFIKKYPLLKIKGGILENKILGIEEINRIANLPPKKQLLTQVVFLLNSPLLNLVNVLSSPMRNLVSILYNIKDKKEKNQ